MKKFKAFKSIGSLLMIFALIGLFSTSLIVKNAFADEKCYGGCQTCMWELGEGYSCTSSEEQGSWCFCRAQDPEEFCNLSWHYRCFPEI